MLWIVAVLLIELLVIHRCNVGAFKNKAVSIMFITIWLIYSDVCYYLFSAFACYKVPPMQGDLAEKRAEHN